MKKKKKTIKKITYGLATASMITLTSGCTNEEVSIPKTASINTEDAKVVCNDWDYFADKDYSGDTYVFKGQEYKEAHDPSIDYIANDYTGISYDNGLNTHDLFFIRIDGKIYLATKLVDINANNIVSKYYAIDTGEFLGQTLDINWYARATKDLETIFPLNENTEEKEYKIVVDDNLNDRNYFNGEYGLGKNLSKGNIISASSIFSNASLTKSQIENLLADSLLISSYVEKYYFPDNLKCSREDYTFIPVIFSDKFGVLPNIHTIAFNGETSYYFNDMLKFEIKDNDNNIKRIAGYRASTNKNDRGYNYIYDIASSSYIDLSQFEILKAEQAFGPYTIGELKKRLDSCSDSYYSIDDLKVASTLNLEGDDVFEKYYITKMNEYGIKSTYEWKILGENDSVFLRTSFDGAKIIFYKNGFVKKTSAGEYNGMMISLKECLMKNDMSYYIKETYTEEELPILLKKLRNKDLDLGKAPDEVYEYYKRINIEDIVVIDTEKESGDSIIVDSEQKCYAFMPYEVDETIKLANPDIKYYESCDHGLFCEISFERNFVKIYNCLEQFFYIVYKPEGELECVSTFENTLRETGLEDCIQNDYALLDVGILIEQINEAEPSLK